MNRLYSSLIINGQKFPTVHQVLKPRYNKQFFKRLTLNVELLRKQIQKRASNLDSELNLDELKRNSQILLSLKERLEKLAKDNNSDDSHEIAKTKAQLHELEDKIMPFVLKIPNRNNKQLPNEEKVLDEVKSDFLTNQKLSKVLSYRKLSYINKCYSKSVVGQNSHYYSGIGAKLQYGMSDFFADQLEAGGFIPTSGMCLTKSAIIEACNPYETKTFTNDPCRILEDEREKLTTLHLVESSRESLVSFLPTLGHISSNEPLRLMISGSGYKTSSSWFDSDHKGVTQYETLHALSLTPSIDSQSMKEYQRNREIIWDVYKKLKIPTRLIQCSVDTMFSNEYDASRVDIWLPSQQNWIQVARISHYLDYITVRMGIKRGHIIDSTVYDGQALFAGIVENTQTWNGKFVIPPVLKDHLSGLSDDELKDYFISNHTNQSKETLEPPLSSGTSNLNNYEQRRYYKRGDTIRRSSVFSHSKRSRIRMKKFNWIIVPALLFYGCLIDWIEFWRSYVPRWFQRITWDYCYRMPKMALFRIMLPEEKLPRILAYDELDRNWFEMSHHELKEQSLKDVNRNFALRRDTPRK